MRNTIITFVLVLTVSTLLTEAFLFGSSDKNKTTTPKSTKAPKSTTTKALKSACEPNPCKNKASCKLTTINESLCVCTPGFHGQYCQLKTKSSVCDPNPCDNKATCKLELTNSQAFKCNCTEGYFGQYCDKKNGCHKNKCKKGSCVLDPKNPSNYTCKCDKGFLGPFCDVADGCSKNPCKNGECKLDAKLKPSCACSAGWGGKNCDKRNCTVVQFKGKHIEKKSNKVWVQESILKKYEDLDGLAQLCKVKLHILKSFTLNPSAKDNKFDTLDKLNAHYYIGHAVRIEIYDEEDKLLCNDICLAKIPIPEPRAKCFIDGLNAIKWKWSILDPTTVHTGFATANVKEYNELREHIQVGCKETKF